MLITQGEKRETSTQNLQRNNVARQVEGSCISYFAAFGESYIYSIALQGPRLTYYYTRPQSFN